jgi:serine/threonine-protein kinase
LYEIFTGKPALQFDSIPELIKKHQTETPTNPSEILKEINPLVEKTILHCLEKNPADRPKNALQVALMLPGGNPLEAAIAAGETPSPEMVAAAPKRGALKSPVALALLAGVIACFAFLVYFSYPVKQHRWLPLEKPPEVLLERAKSIAQKFGYTSAPADSAYSFNTDPSYSGYIRQKRQTEPSDSWVNSGDWRERLRTGQPDEIYFWYRQSPRYFSRFGDTKVDYFNPSATETSGMVRMALDVRGRLTEFTAVPPQIEADNLQKVSTDWAAVFAEAGLDVRNYKPTVSKWTPWTYSDERAAWEGGLVDHPEIPVRIEAAAHQGKPVYFKVIMPWDEPYRQQEDTMQLTPSVRIGRTIFVTSIVCVLIAGIFVAGYNFRAGRADTKGAFKVLVFVFAAYLIADLLIEPRFSSSVYNLNFIRESVADALFAGVTTWIGYLAIEPFVRKHWASLSVSWIRLMAGDWRDPLVGRDILIGGLFGLLHTTVIYFLNFNSKGLTFDAVNVFSGGGGIIGAFGRMLSFPIFIMTLMLLLVIILTIVFRRRWLAMAVLWFLHFLVLGLIFFGSASPRTLVGAAVIATIMVVPLMRFGMLAYVAYYVFFNLTHTFPLTTNVSSWYFNATVFAAIVIIGLASYGFYTSIAGQPIFGGKILKEIE